MLDDSATKLWGRVCATVNRLGGPRSPRVHASLQAEPQTILDLHGYRIHDAYYAVRNFLETSSHRRVTIVTGKGEMAREIHTWLELSPSVRSFKALNGGGAFEVRLISN